MAGGLKAEHDSLLLRASVLSLVNIIPAIRFGIVWQPSALVLAQFLHGLRLHQHTVDRDRLLLWTVKHIGCVLVEDDGLPVEVPALHHHH